MINLITANKYCESVFDGTHDSPKANESGFPLITSKNILNGVLNLNDTYLISEKDYLTIQNRSSVKKWDIIFSMIGSVGEVYLEKNNEIPYAIKNVGVFSTNDEFKAKWLYYYLKSPYAKIFIKNSLAGAVQKFLSLGKLRDFPIFQYDRSKDDTINFLSALDDKIELNNQINTELEAMAKTLYDYWFVQFDFPDENGKPYKSSGGKMVFNETLKREIPVGWEVKKLSAFAKTGSGGTPKSTVKEYYENGQIPWINSGELNQPFIVKTENFISEIGLKNSSAKLFPKQTILMAMYGATAGKTSIISFEATTNQAICAVMPLDKIMFYYTKHVLDDMYKYLINLSTGSARDNLSQDKIRNLDIVIPSEELSRKFCKIVTPFFRKIEINLQENQELAQLRDWLLPMLMNGQVRVGCGEYEREEESLGMVAESGKSKYEKI